MENKNVGILLVGISLILGILTWIFNSSLEEGIGEINYQGMGILALLTLSISAVIFIAGLFLIFVKQKASIPAAARKRTINLEELNDNEKKIIEILRKENGSIFQGKLIERLKMGKVGVTRLLDKLEAKGLIERKRKGMNNIVVLIG